MNFKEWLLSEEIHFQNKVATVYHRTCTNCDKEESIKSVSGILTSDYKVGTGCMYGCGLYTTYTLESQFSNYMNSYGKVVAKFKVEELDKYLVFQLMPAYNIHGDNYKISDQLKKLGVLDKVDPDKLKGYDEQQKEKYSSPLALRFYNENKQWIESIRGIMYYGPDDGHCLLKYQPVQDGTITLLSYAVAAPIDMKKMEELKNPKSKLWITSTDKASIKSIYKSTSDKDRFSFGDNSYVVKKLLNSKNLRLTVKRLGPELNQLSDSNVRYFIWNAPDRNEMAELIIEYKPELSDDNVDAFLEFAPDIDRIAELIVKYKTELSNDGIRQLLEKSTKKDAIAKLIIDKQPELSNWNVIAFIRHAIDIDAIAALLGTYNINKLSDSNVKNLLKNSMLKIPSLPTFEKPTNQQKIAKIINKYYKNITPEIQQLIDKYLHEL